MNEEQTSSATSFSYFLKSEDWRMAINYIEVITRVTVIRVSLITFLIKSSIFLFNPCILDFDSVFLDYERFNVFPLMEYAFLDCKQYVCGGENTLMSISDAWGPSSFCGKMEKVRIMREEMYGKIVYFPTRVVFLTFIL